MTRRTPLILLAVITALLVYVTTRGLPQATRVWTTILVTGLPPMSVLQARALTQIELPSRLALYAQTSFSLWLLAAATAAVAYISDIGAAELGLSLLPLTDTLVWTGALAFAGVTLMLIAHRLGVREVGAAGGGADAAAPSRRRATSGSRNRRTGNGRVDERPKVRPTAPDDPNRPRGEDPDGNPWGENTRRGGK